MSKVKNQHYVPRFYLKRFTEDGSSLYAFEKKDGRVFRANIAGVASQKYFYDILDHPELNPQDVEHSLAELEGVFAKALAEFLEEVEQGDRFTVGHTARNLHLAEFLLIQMVRTPDFRELLEGMVNNIYKGVFGLLMDFERANGNFPPDKPSPAPPRFEATPLNHATFMFNNFMPCYAPMLLNHLWYVSRNTTDHPYFTSDSPVVMHCGEGAGAFGGVGFLSPGVEIMLPLSSKYTLLLLERSFWESQFQVPEGTVISVRDRAQIIRSNRVQLVNCRRQTYSAQNHFDLYA